MKQQKENKTTRTTSLHERGLIVALCLLLCFPAGYLMPASAQEPSRTEPEPTRTEPEIPPGEEEVFDGEIAIHVSPDKGEATLEVPDSVQPTIVTADDYAYDESGKIKFNPSPTRAVWLSALCPGLGQIYNRRYWKLPIVIGGFMGLGYATDWNNKQYQDYMQGYRDLLDNDPQTRSYMDFFPSTVNESDLDKAWLERTFKSRKDYARRNRDLCIIGLVALYALCMLDAYVDASLTHFDVSPDISLDWSPTLLEQKGGNGRPAVGLNWAFTF